MELRSAIEDRAQADARMLDRAEGVLVALRRCTINAAFNEIVGASKRHRVPALSIARALVALAQESPLRVGLASGIGEGLIRRAARGMRA